MLVLSRKPGESLRIGDNVKVTIVAVSNSQVRLAIDAPQSVGIHREEVYEKIVLVNQEAAKGSEQGLPSGASPGALRVRRKRERRGA